MTQNYEQVYVIQKNLSLIEKPIITDEQIAANKIVAKIQDIIPEINPQFRFNIPDELELKHEFIKEEPCICGEIKEISQFNIPGLGIFRCGYKAFVKCSFLPSICRPSSNGPSCCSRLIEFCSCDDHTYPKPDYYLENNGIRMEFWQEGNGKIKMSGRTVIEFLQTFPNHCDAGFGHCYSAFPKLKISFADYPGRNIVLKPEVSECPESVLGILACCAICGINKTSRKFIVGQGSGQCVIKNTRTIGEAFAKICLLQGRCFLPDVDYPKFQIQFKGEDQIEKLAIVMGLIHYCIIKKWYLIAHITQNITGLA